MNSLPSSVKAVISKLPRINPFEITSLEGFLKLMGLKFDWTTNKFETTLSFDSSLNADEELILFSEIIGRYIRCERVKKQHESVIKDESCDRDDENSLTKNLDLKKENKQPKQIQKQQQSIKQRDRIVTDTLKPSQEATKPFDIQQLKKKNITKKMYKGAIAKKADLEKEQIKLKRRVRQLQYKIQQEKIQMKRTVRQLKYKIREQEKLIAPSPISKATIHLLTVTRLKEPKMYRLSRVQARNLRRRLTQIADEEGYTYEQGNSSTKIFQNLPHAIDTASCVRDFLKLHNLNVYGKTQIFEWKRPEEELHKLIELFNDRLIRNVLPEAEKSFKATLITQYFSPVNNNE